MDALLYSVGPLSLHRQDDGFLRVTVAASNAVFTPEQLAGFPAVLFAQGVPVNGEESGLDAGPSFDAPVGG